MGFTWWASWFEQARISGVDTSQGLYFSYSALVIAAALEGQGVALVPRPYIEQELTEHRLVVLDKRTLALGTGMYAVWSTADGIRLSDTAKKLCDWLVLETAPYRA
jgi:DNA-binding transcriptional LysR family regulator